MNETSQEDPRARAGLEPRKGEYGSAPVKWLSVRQLVRTGLEVALAGVFARFADKRETMAALPAQFYALTPSSLPPGEDTTEIHFAADTGDGFDATLAVARLLEGCPACPTSEKEQSETLPHADLLVLGGDEVYPVASAAEYRQRLTGVFRAARYAEHPDPDPRPFEAARPPVLALPGNHDWYDGLTAFRRVFCESWIRVDGEVGTDSLTRIGRYEPAAANSRRDSLGSWATVQNRSYFAVRVHPNWWLWGLDSQLDAPIDAAQLAYFRRAERLVGKDQGLIVCTATPCWMEADEAGERPIPFDRETPLVTLTGFLRRTLGSLGDPRLRLILTGDKHHYARYQATSAITQNAAPSEQKMPTVSTGGELQRIDGPELVTCGGGGAFTMSTHHLKPTLAVPWEPTPPNHSRARRLTDYTLAKTYPSAEQSRAMRNKTWKLPFLNGPIFPFMVGLLLTAAFFQRAYSPKGVDFQDVAAAVILAAIFLGYAATGIRGRSNLTGLARLLRVIAAGSIHGIAQLTVVTIVLQIFRLVEVQPKLWLVLFLWPFFTCTGMLVFTAYLILCERAGYHQLEAFASFRSEQYKCILHLSFTDDQVACTVVGLDEVPPARDAAQVANGKHWATPQPRTDIDTFAIPLRPR
ncbi:MAG: hypothetical protein QM650_14995 [Microlunatus sp.]